jgi:hypothetical protein
MAAMKLIRAAGYDCALVEASLPFVFGGGYDVFCRGRYG